MKAAVLSATKVSFENPAFKTVDGRTVAMLKRMMNFDPTARPSAEEVLCCDYITQRKTLSNRPIEGLAGNWQRSGSRLVVPF